MDLSMLSLSSSRMSSLKYLNMIHSWTSPRDFVIYLGVQGMPPHKCSIIIQICTTRELKWDLPSPLIAGKYKWQTSAFLLLVFIQSLLLPLLLILLYCKGCQGIKFLFCSLFSWRMHHGPFSHLPSSRSCRCLSRLHTLCCRKSFGNLFLLCVAHCMRPWVLLVLMIRVHLQWISSTILYFRLSIWFPYGLRMRKIGVNVYWLKVWKILADSKGSASEVFVEGSKDEDSNANN